MFSKLAVFATLVAGASAECANSCSGRGHCTNYAAVFSTYPVARNQVPATSPITGGAGTVNALGYDDRIPMKDSCTCFVHSGFIGASVYQFTGADCSLKTCPHAIAFNGQALASNDVGTTRGSAYHTQHMPCSNQGACNFKTGTCECFDGYTGEACQRTVCPNDCNGVGMCTELWQIVEDVSENTNYYGNYLSTVTYTAWDQKQLRGCVCDVGRSGPDCSQVDCPSGTDPLGGDGAEKGRPCSGRGMCDLETGECQCFGGYHGSNCASQRNQAM